MGLRSLFPKKEIRYRADRDRALNMMVSSKGKKIENVTEGCQKHKQMVLYEYYNIQGFENPFCINFITLILLLLSKAQPLY